MSRKTTMEDRHGNGYPNLWTTLAEQFNQPKDKGKQNNSAKMIGGSYPGGNIK